MVVGEGVRFWMYFEEEFVCLVLGFVVGGGCGFGRV